MSARTLDGAATVAQRSRSNSRTACRGVHRRAPAAAGLGIVLVGDDPGVGDLRSQQVEVGGRVRAARGPRSGCRPPRSLARAPGDRGAAQREPGARRHPRPVAAAGRPWARTAERWCSTRWIRPRTWTASIRTTSGGWCRGGRRSSPARRSGVIELLERSGIAIAGARAVVIGRSDIVGKPMALLLLHRDATVTICHSRTRDLPRCARRRTSWWRRSAAPAFVTPDFVKPGATVVDVGINRVTERDAGRAAVLRGHPRRDDSRPRGACRRRRAPGGRGGGRRDHAGAGRRRSPDDRNAALEHAEGCRGTMLKVALTGGIVDRQELRSGAGCHARRADRGRRRDRPRDRLGAESDTTGRRGAGGSAPRWPVPTAASTGRPSARLVFGDPAARRDLEAIVHPRVYERISQWAGSQRAAGAAWVLADIPLLFETGREGDFDRVIVAACVPEEQLRRLMRREASARPTHWRGWPRSGRSRRRRRGRPTWWTRAGGSRRPTGRWMPCAGKSIERRSARG